MSSRHFGVIIGRQCAQLFDFLFLFSVLFIVFGFSVSTNDLFQEYAFVRGAFLPSLFLKDPIYWPLGNFRH